MDTIEIVLLVIALCNAFGLILIAARPRRQPSDDLRPILTDLARHLRSPPDPNVELNKRVIEYAEKAWDECVAHSERVMGLMADLHGLNAKLGEAGADRAGWPSAVPETPVSRVRHEDRDFVVVGGQDGVGDGFPVD